MHVVLTLRVAGVDWARVHGELPLRLEDLINLYDRDIVWESIEGGGHAMTLAVPEPIAQRVKEVLAGLPLEVRVSPDPRPEVVPAHMPPRPARPRERSLPSKVAQRREEQHGPKA